MLDDCIVQKRNQLLMDDGQFGDLQLNPDYDYYSAKPMSFQAVLQAEGKDHRNYRD